MDKIIKMTVSIDYKSLDGNFGKNFGNSGARPIGKGLERLMILFPQKNEGKTLKSIKGEKMDYMDAEKAFENAIKKGLENPNDYMYMYSINQKDYFKHINTRNYISIKRNDEEEE